MKKKNLALFQSVAALILCISMLVGTTFAWFTDSVVSGINTIAAGNLDVELFHSNAAVKDEKVNSATDLFLDLQGDPILWEPGVVSYENLRVTNAGDLALAYQLAINTDKENYVLDASGNMYGLSQILKVGVVEGGVTAADRAGVVASVEDSDWTELSEFLRSGSLLPEGAGESEQTWGIVIYWEPGENDNLWNLNNGKTLTEGEALSIELGISLVATQEQYESDAFGSDYDAWASTDVFPEFEAEGSVSAGVTTDADNKVSSDVTLSSEQLSASIPAGVQLDAGTTELTMTVSEMDESAANITLGENDAMRSLDVHISGVAANNTVPMEISIKEAAPKGLNAGNLELYHVENGVSNPMTLVDSFTAHNQFKYDPATGDITLYMATFSEVAVVADTENAWNGTITAFAGGSGAEKDPYIIANADQLAYLGDRVSKDNANYGSAHYKLIADINIGGIDNYNDNTVIWYPIGYHKPGEGANKAGETEWYTYGGAFSGTFDGTGHTISGIYQNTWAMDGNYDKGYWNAAMGLFGYVYGGTVKNLTIDNFYSEGEFAPTGCVTAYAADEATFENIAITNSHPQTYNTGVAGIVGWDNGGDTEADASKFTFKNITVDDTNTISALWGSWDVAAAGLLGYLGEYSKASFENCNVAATIDVYNDVCGNYQYYWYRYCGAFIGTVDKRLDNGNGALDLTNVTATNCTVNFGDRHEYYYCEFIENSIASYTHDYQFSRVDKKDIIGSGESATCQNHNHEEHGYETVDGNSVLVEDKQAVYIPFRQLFGGYGWGVDGVDLDEYDDIEISNVTNAQEKFETKFTGEFLYRVGNQNAVNVGSLFAVKDGAAINNSGVYVTIDKVDENSNVGGTFNANTSDWTKATIQFSGTGIVTVTIQDFDYCAPTVLHLEVVDATNATSAVSATDKNIVLLNDCGFSSLGVSGGYTLYGNGFTMTCGSDSAVLDMGYSFVTLNNGTLDNVQIVCPNFDYAALYKSNLTSSENRSETTDKTRYYNAKSGVMASGNSQILNSRISGGRAAVNVSGGNVVIDNSRIELGAVASVLVGSANSLTLRDVTLIQKPTASTHDSSKTLMGFSVLYLCDSEGNATPTTLEGSFVQQAWIDEDDAQYVPSAGKEIVTAVLKETDYLHDIDGDGTNESLNLGFAYMPEDASKTVAMPTNITDNRTDKATVPYEMKSVNVQLAIIDTTVYVYSYKNTKGTNEDFNKEDNYKPNAYGDIITVTYSDGADGLTTGKSYVTDGWVYELNVDLDKASGYVLDFSKLSMSVNGVTVTDFKVNGGAKPTSPVAVTAGGTTYTLTATIDGKEYTATYKVTGTETSKESPSLVGTPSYGAGFGVANKYGGDWSAAAPVLDGITIKYWSVADSEYKEFALSSITFANTGKQNGTNNYWEYTHTNNDFTLKLTNTAVIHSSSGTYGMPVAGKDGKLYFTISSSGGFVSTGTTSRSIAIAYEFTDNNGGDTLKFSYTWSIPYSKDEQYNYSSFTSDGTLTPLTSSSGGGGNGCVTPDTLVTLADGTQKRIDEVTYEDQLLVWDFVNGEYAAMPSIVVRNHGYDNYRVLTLDFSDGSKVNVIAEHAFFDVALNEFVMIDEFNVADYVGHAFMQTVGDGFKTITLESYSITEEYTAAYSILTAIHYNCVLGDMLTLTPNVIGGNYFMPFEVGQDMRFDVEKMQADIEQYGLFTYEDFADYVTEEQFYALNAPQVKVAVGKGIITMEQLYQIIEELIPKH